MKKEEDKKFNAVNFGIGFAIGYALAEGFKSLIFHENKKKKDKRRSR